MSDEPTTLPAPAPVAAAAGAPKPPTGAEILARQAELKVQELSLLESLRDQPLRHSESLGKLAQALSRAQGKMKAAERDSKNPFFKSKYASLASVLDACRDQLAAEEIAYFQPVRTVGRGVVVITLLVHSSGEWIEERLTMMAESDAPQKVGSTITYARRYGLSAMTGVAPADDDDGAAATSTVPEGVRNDKGTGPLQTKPGASDELADEASAAPPAAAAAAPAPVAPKPPPPAAPRPVAAAPAAPKAAAPATAAAKPATASAQPAKAVTPPPPGMKPPAKAPGA